MIQVTQSSMPSKDEYIKEIESIWNTKWLTNMGSKHKQLEADLKQYLNVTDIALFCNGHMALEMCLQAMNLSGEVITSPFTFASTTHAIVRNGLTPIFCDINEENYTIDAHKIEELITEKTSAIVPVHVYGRICDVKAIEAIAKKHNIKVIYDAAHTFGITVNGQGVGTFGDASMFSFHATKVFHTIEGGAVTFNDPKLRESLSHLKNFGIMGPESVEAVGGNAKMNEFQAAMGICNLRHVNVEIAKRKSVVQRYRSHLKDISGIRIFDEVEGIQSNYAYFPIVFDEMKFGKNRNEICDKLMKQNIIPRKYFYPLTSTFDCYQNRFHKGDTPNAIYIANRVLTLPLYADLQLEDVDRICKIILED